MDKKPANSSEILEKKPLRDERGRLLPNQVSLNPNGKPKGTYSLKSKIIQLLKDNPDIEKKLVNDLLKKEQGLIYQMIDGRPKQDVSVEQKEPPTPILSLGNLTEASKSVINNDIDNSKLLESP